MPDIKPITRARRTEFTTREVEETNTMLIEGYFVVFNQPYYIDDYCEEVIAPDAFNSADTSDVRALIDHIPAMVLGRSNDTVHTLTWSIDDTGLFASIEINPDDKDALSLRARVLRGDVDQASFGFDELEVTYTDLADGRVRRTINRISKLWEISVCTFPAYEQTYVSARSRETAELIAHRREKIRKEKNKLKRRLTHA